MENNYLCPYCGKEIGKEEILFWETVKTQYTDNVRGDFLRRHGVKVTVGNKFPRIYYHVRPDNVVREDANGFPTMVEDHLGNALTPEELNRGDSHANGDDFDDDFDADGFDEVFESRNEGRGRELHNIPKRACPRCHCDLPQQFGTMKTYHVAMFGGRAAGKTAYLVNLFQQANAQLSQNNLGSIELASESRGFMLPMIEEYERTGTTLPTPADDGLLPILCYYRNRGSEAFVTFYDIAGEGTADPAYMANHKGIAKCESLILMIDPNMFVGGAFYSQWTANHMTMRDQFGDSSDCCKEPLDSFLNQAGELCKEYSDGIKYIACVVTKLDMLLEAEEKFFGSGDIEMVNDVGTKHRDAVNLQVLDHVHQDLNTYLKAQHRVDLLEKVSYVFGKDVRIRLLGVSTSTRRADITDRIQFEARSSSRDAKHRIIEPLLVILMYFGLVNAKDKEGRILQHGDEKPPVQETVVQAPRKVRRWPFGRGKK